MYFSFLALIENTSKHSNKGLGMAPPSYFWKKQQQNISKPIFNWYNYYEYVNDIILLYLNQNFSNWVS